MNYQAARLATEERVAFTLPPAAAVYQGEFVKETFMAEFWEKYKDPRWQKKRLEIMQFYSFKCAHCGSAEKTLNVHHRIYHKGRDPWDYDDAELQCLCEECHEESHSLHKSIKSCLAYLDDSVAAVVLGYLRAHMTTEHPDARMYVNDVASLEGVADFCLGTTQQVDHMLEEDQSISGKELLALRRMNLERLQARDQG